MAIAFPVVFFAGGGRMLTTVYPQVSDTRRFMEQSVDGRGQFVEMTDLGPTDGHGVVHAPKAKKT